MLYVFSYITSGFFNFNKRCNMNLPNSRWDIKSILAKGAITTYFQPIVSVIKKSVVGVEALARGIDHNCCLIPPYELFKSAEKEFLTIELDRLCRAKALNSFSGIHPQHSDLLLFLNIDVSILDKVGGSNYLQNKVEQWGLNPENIVLEINESKVNDLSALKKFIDRYRRYGFLIALDDIGSGFSNLDRVPLAEPNIIKIDRGIMQNIDSQYYKQEVFKSLVNLSQKIGALVIAEGIEREAEALMATELGASMLQGFYFAKPQPYNRQMFKYLDQHIGDTARKYEDYMGKKIMGEAMQHRNCNSVVDEISKGLNLLGQQQLERKLQQIIKKYPFVECAYVLNQWGMQITDTICNYQSIGNSIMFQPASKGMDHTLKKYFYYPRNTGQSRFSSDPYVSLATGNLCITISQTFKDNQGEDCLLCLDFTTKSVL